MDEKIFVLNKDFESIAKITNYQSFMWVDRYRNVGEFELSVPVSMSNVFDIFKGDNYIWYSGSDKLMIIEYLEIDTSRNDYPILLVKGRSLESILDRRILLYDTVFNENLEDAIRQILDVSMMSGADSERRIPNFRFEYSGDDRIRNLTCNYEFNKGDSVFDTVYKILAGAKLGFKITLDEENNFVMKLIIGEDRSYSQDSNPWVVFSPKFNNLSTSNFVHDGSDNFRNVIYTVGEEYKGAEAPVLISGTTEGLLRRELYNDASSISHEVEEESGKKTLTNDEYMAQLRQSADDLQMEHIIEQKAECEVDTKLNYEYGKDYFIGDIVQVENEFGQEIKMRVVEFITHISTSGIELYPTFKNIEEEEDEET